MTGSEYRAFSEANPDAVVVADASGRISFANLRVEAMLGYAPSELLGETPELLVPERYRHEHAGHMERYLKDPSPRMMGAGFALAARRKDGTEFASEISLSPYRSTEGQVVIVAIRQITGTPQNSELQSENSGLRDLLRAARRDAARLLEEAGIDATEREGATRLQRLLLDEMHHRTKNMLTMVMAITSQTLRSATTTEEAQIAIASRLTALGRAQDLLLSADDSGAFLPDLIAAAIEPFDGGGRPRMVVSVPAIEIGSAAVLPLTLSLNELCTNAVKYGALSRPSGQIQITSVLDEQRQSFWLRWLETGGPSVVPPTRRGFGTRLLEALAGQLHGEATVRYEPAGLIYQLDGPLPVLRAQSAA